MRPINKGEQSKEYIDYKDARDDLIERIGFYCSYCEMSLYNRPDVEHVHPRKNGGQELEWDNFLISCTYCNSNKNNNNLSRNSYIWPDTHNTFMAFVYKNNEPISVNDFFSDEEKELIHNTINLLKLDREPGNGFEIYHKDTRWLSRLNAWDLALESLADYEEEKSESVARCIARTARANGHFSIWMEVFKEYKDMRRLIINEFKGTALECFDEDTNAINFYRNK